MAHPMHFHHWHAEENDTSALLAALLFALTVFLFGSIAVFALTQDLPKGPAPTPILDQRIDTVMP